MFRNLGFLLIIASSTSLSMADTEEAIFAGGCFWCMESEYQELEGVSQVISGFIGGVSKNPTYSGDHQGHYEAVKVTYNPDVISYQDLLKKYWLSIDPFDDKGQFCDKGPSYRAAIFPANPSQKTLAQASLQAIKNRFNTKTVYTKVLDANDFWPVEEYHQDYYLKNPLRYKYYRWNCGRDQRLEALWGQASAH